MYIQNHPKGGQSSDSNAPETQHSVNREQVNEQNNETGLSAALYLQNRQRKQVFNKSTLNKCN